MKVVLRTLVAIVAALVASAACASEAVYRRTGSDGLIEYSNQPQVGSERVIVIHYEPAPGRAVAPLAIRIARRIDPAIDALIAAASATHRVDASLLRAVIAIESGFDPLARSSAGAIGLMQLMPGTARRYGVADALDPAQNIDGGTRYLRDLLAQFRGDVRLVLAAYNAGEGAVIRHGLRIPPFPETQSYVPAVMERLRDELALQAAPRDGKERPKR